MASELPYARYTNNLELREVGNIYFGKEFITSDDLRQDREAWGGLNALCHLWDKPSYTPLPGYNLRPVKPPLERLRGLLLRRRAPEHATLSDAAVLRMLLFGYVPVTLIGEGEDCSLIASLTKYSLPNEAREVYGLHLRPKKGKLTIVPPQVRTQRTVAVDRYIEGSSGIDMVTGKGTLRMRIDFTPGGPRRIFKAPEAYFRRN